jgi:septal ring factor EnvC (AmiA/AmiB activator)
MKCGIHALIVLVVLLAAAPAVADDAGAADPEEVEQNLAEVRKRIRKLEKQTRRAVESRGSAQKALRKAEISESKVHGQLQQVDKELGGARERLAALEQKAGDAERELDGHRAELQYQLRQAYVAGREDFMRTILSQGDPVQLGRQLVYYRYIARQRSTLLESVRRQLQTLSETAAAVALEQARLEGIQTKREKQLGELSGARKQRHLALAKIDKNIESQSGQIDNLRLEAKDLESLVNELTRLRSTMPLTDSTPFRQSKGQLDWPADGRLARKFGQPRADGRLRWEGVLLAANAGADVRAVHHGRVVYSDWLPGLGLLVVIEHGDGYLSLYGHNQDVMTEVGDWVGPGAIIAHVGDSGGQSSPGLYFEIRKDGTPVDPGSWVQR